MDLTMIPDEFYPGGSVTDFSNLKKRTIKGIAERHHRFTGKWGWHSSTTTLEKIALVASEVGEAANECRGKTPTPEFKYELADIILRVVDIAECEGLDLEAAILEKMDKNDKRDLSHRIK